MRQNTLLSFGLVWVCSVFALYAQATVVEVRTVQGNIQINLFDDVTPNTVQNFLDYVNSGAYANNVVHRSVDNFIIQAGGFTFNGDFPLDNVATGTSVENEPELSNVRGTIAMAKMANDPNSATSQWFINLTDNSANLDVQNGGFTVFGQVLGNGMEVVDAIATLPRFNLGGALQEMPLVNYTAQDANAGVDIGEDNLVIIEDIVVIDATTITNPQLNPTPNTLINNNGTGNDNGNGADQSPSSGGGSTTPWILCFLALVFMFKNQSLAAKE